MREVKVILELFEKGDRVLTPHGEGMVTESEEIPVGSLEIYFRDINVRMDEVCYEYERYRNVEAKSCILLKDKEDE